MEAILPRTGGVYSPPAGTKGVPNTTIQSVPYNALIDDLTADANAARPVTAGGTGATSASGARTALGVQAAHAALTSISGLATVANRMLYATAENVYATTALTPFARTILDDADATTVRETIGANDAANLTSGMVANERLAAPLSSIAGLATVADKVLYTTDADSYATTTLTAFGRSILDDADAATALTTLGVSAFMKTVLDDADAATARTTIGLDDSDLPWLAQPIGGFVVYDDGVSGLSPPPTDKGYRYVELTAGLTGAGQYNEGCLTSESVSGSAPLIEATAVVSLEGSLLNGQTIRLLNTEGRFIRPSAAPGTLQDDAMQQLTGSFENRRRDGPASVVVQQSGVFQSGGISAASWARLADGSTNGGTDITIFDSALVARSANETRPRNIGIKVYRRIK